MSQVSPSDIQRWKGLKPRPLVLTATDYPTARILDEAGLEMIHVGDSLGMVALGYEDTTHVTLEEMTHHCRAVARGVKRALITADVPACCMVSPKDAARAARALAESGAHAVKLEGGHEIEEHLDAVARAGVRLVGHVGLLPQRAAAEGGYRRKGRSIQEAERIADDAVFLQEKGCFAVVVECVHEDAAREVTRRLRVPTIGIYSGSVCDSEIRVLHDVLGLSRWSAPKGSVPLLDVSQGLIEAINSLKTQISE